MRSIKKGDLVIALGSTKTKAGAVEEHRVLAKIIDVGKYDVFAKEINSIISASAPFRVSKKSCIKVDRDSAIPSYSLTIPKMGDLVLAYKPVYKTGASGYASITGILVEIIDKPGKHKQAKLLQGANHEYVSFEDLIILDH